MNPLVVSTLFLMSSLLTFQAEPPRLTRISYDVELISKDRRLTVDLVLNLLDDQHFSISCRKNPGGQIFTCWVTPEDNYVYFPKMETAFRGAAPTLFGLFPGGPELSREQWFLLLYRRNSGTIGDYKIIRKDGWRLLDDPRLGFQLRWRETLRQFKTRYSKKVLQPRYEDVTTYELREMKQFWDERALEE